MNEYQDKAASTSGFAARHGLDRTWCAAVGLSGEAGELLNALKKMVYHDHGLNREEVAKELGDCLWYIAEMATAWNISLNEVAAMNITKLTRRYPDGFTPEDSKNRKLPLAEGGSDD